MTKHQIATETGYYWAKLVHPRHEPEGEDWASSRFEIVEVDENYGDDDDQLRVYVPGIGPSQLIDAFVWGPKVCDALAPDAKPPKIVLANLILTSLVRYACPDNWGDDKDVAFFWLYAEAATGERLPSSEGTINQITRKALASEGEQ